MSKPNRPSFSRSLRLGTLLLTLASLAACAGAQRGFAGASVTPSQPDHWGFATLSESSEPAVRGYAQISEPAQPESWGYAQLSTQPDSSAQALRASAPTSAQR